MLKKIVVIGPESTGKSTLCEMLSLHYQSAWCKEYAREYLLTNGKTYAYPDLLTIAKGQLALEDKAAEALINAHQHEKNDRRHLLFVDTDMYVMKVWCEYVFNDCHNWILKRIAERPYDLYLLCKPDMLWVQDELREYPAQKPRQELYHIYKDLLVNQQVPWAEIHGDYEQRLVLATAAVSHHLLSENGNLAAEPDAGTIQNAINIQLT